MILAHLSDIHLCMENGGRRQRRLIMDLLKRARRGGAQHFLFSGDLVEYANHSELTELISDLRGQFSANEVSLLPGNHDIFPVSKVRLWRTLFRFSKHEKYFERFKSICGDFFGTIISEKPLVYFRKLSDSLCLFAVDTNDYSIQSHRQCARGRVTPKTWSLIDQAIQDHGLQSHKKVLMLHHYPFRWGDSINERAEVDFVDLQGVQNEIEQRDWLMVLCGHSHRNSGVRTLGGTKVINSASRPRKGHYVCSLIDTEMETLLPRRIETNLDSRIRMIFNRHARR